MSVFLINWLSQLSQNSFYAGIFSIETGFFRSLLGCLRNSRAEHTFHPESFLLKIGIPWKRRWLALTQIGKDKPEGLLGWTTLDADLLHKRFLLGGLLYTLS